MQTAPTALQWLLPILIFAGLIFVLFSFSAKYAKIRPLWKKGLYSSLALRYSYNLYCIIIKPTYMFYLKQVCTICIIRVDKNAWLSRQSQSIETQCHSINHLNTFRRDIWSGDWIGCCKTSSSRGCHHSAVVSTFVLRLYLILILFCFYIN